MKDPAEPFRTKIRVKGAGSPAAEEPRAASPRPGSLMEALNRARSPQAAARPQKAGNVTGQGPKPDSRHDRDAAEHPSPPAKPSRPARAKVGRLAAAKLRQLQRAREAAASLESLARGEVEEAIVEIVPRDGKRKDHARPGHTAPKR